MQILEKRKLFIAGSGTHFAVVFTISFALAKLFGITFNKIFTNVLTKQEIGMYTLIFTAIQTLYTYASFGFPSSLTRYSYRYYNKGQKNEMKNFVFTGFMTYQIINIIIISLLVILHFTVDFRPSFLDVDPYLFSLLIVGIISMTQISSTICFTIASSLQNSRYYAIPVIMRALLQVPFGIFYVIILKLQVFGLVLGLVTTEATVSVYSGYIIIRDIGIGKFSWTLWKQIISYSLPTYLMNLLFNSYNLLILTYVNAVFDKEGLEIIALYKSGALVLVNTILVAQQMFRIVYRPIIIKYYEREQYKDMEAITIELTKLYSVVYVIISFILYAFSPMLIVLLTQTAYLPSIPVIPVLLTAYFFDYLRILVAYGHALHYKTYWNLICGTIALSLGILVGVLVIPLTGLMGLGYALLTFRSTQFFMQWMVSQHYFKINYDWNLLLRLLISIGGSIALGIVLNYLFNMMGWNYTITIAFSCSLIVFILLLLLLKVITKEDYTLAKKIIQTYISMKNNNKKEEVVK